MNYFDILIIDNRRGTIDFRKGERTSLWSLLVKLDKEKDETNETKTFQKRSQYDVLYVQEKTKVEENFTST